MRKLFLLLFWAIPMLVDAQPAISVKSFEMIQNDMDARVNFPKRDQNGEVCAIIKVVTTQKDFVWEPDALGIVAAEYKTGEYWLYVPRGARRLTIKHEKLGILRNYQYPIPIQAATVYVMELVTGSVETIVKEAEVLTQWLAISSTPEGASVFVEELLVGTTPFTRKYPEGEFTYRVELPRYHTEAGKVNLSGERKNLTFTMRPKFGSIAVTSTPENGMMVYLNDVNTGKTTPATLTEVASGAQTIKLISQWYQPLAKSVTVTDNQTTRADFAMQPAFAEITIKTEPAADILIDGTKKGNGTYTSRMLAGIYSVKAEIEKHNPDQKQITVTAGTPQSITLNPKPQTGTLDVTSTPFDAKITLNGKDNGTTPTTLRNLLVGDYTLTLTKPGYGTITKTITIAQGKTTEVNETISVTQGGKAGLEFDEIESYQTDTFTDIRDRKTYNYITIGKQVWMAENLAYKPSSGNYWAYDKNPDNVKKYGYLYDWQTAKNVCPTGWHLPSDAEWTQLTDFVGSYAGTKIKAKSGWSSNGNGTDDYGFSALPGGGRNSNGYFYYNGYNGYWWSSSESDTHNAWYQNIGFTSSDLRRINNNKNWGFSVRCLRD